MKFDTVKELRDYVWKELDLDHRSISFFYWEPLGEKLIGSGSIFSRSELEDSWELSDFGDGCPDMFMIDVYSLESWVLGTGETDHASDEDVVLLQEMLDDDPETFDSFLTEWADSLCSIPEMVVENPGFEPDDDDEEEDW